MLPTPGLREGREPRRIPKRDSFRPPVQHLHHGLHPRERCSLSLSLSLSLSFTPENGGAIQQRFIYFFLQHSIVVALQSSSSFSQAHIFEAVCFFAGGTCFRIGSRDLNHHPDWGNYSGPGATQFRAPAGTIILYLLRGRNVSSNPLIDLYDICLGRISAKTALMTCFL